MPLMIFSTQSAFIDFTSHEKKLLLYHCCSMLLQPISRSDATILLVDFLYVIVRQTGDSHFAATFVAESSRDLKSILLFPDGPVDFDFLQGVVCFSAAFCAEVLLILQGGTLPSVFTSLSIIVFLSLFFVNKKPLTVCRSQNPSVGFMSLQIPQTQKIGTRFSASADFVTLQCALIFGVSGVSLA